MFLSFAATRFENLQQLFQICCDFIKSAATLFYLQQLSFICSNFLIPCGPPYVSHPFVFRSKWMRGWLGQVSCQCRLLEYGWILRLQMRWRIYTKRTRTLCRWKSKKRMLRVLCICKENGEVLQRVRNLELTFKYIIYFAFVHLFSTDLVLLAPSPLQLNHTERFSTIRKAKKFFFAQREDRVM